jgi:hypothetical protein
LPAGVYSLFDVRQKVKGVQDFVQDYRLGVQLKKAARICCGCGRDVRRLQGDVAASLAKEMLGKVVLPN